MIIDNKKCLLKVEFKNCYNNTPIEETWEWSDEEIIKEVISIFGIEGLFKYKESDFIFFKGATNYYSLGEYLLCHETDFNLTTLDSWIKDCITKSVDEELLGENYCVGLTFWFTKNGFLRLAE